MLKPLKEHKGTINAAMEIKIGSKTVEDLTQEDVTDFIYNEGYCGSPKYYERPSISYFKVGRVPSDSDATLFFDITQHQKKEFGELIFSYRMHLTLEGNSPVLFSEKHGSYPFKLKEINYFLKRGYKINIFGIDE